MQSQRILPSIVELHRSAENLNEIRAFAETIAPGRFRALEPHVALAHPELWPRLLAGLLATSYPDFEGIVQRPTDELREVLSEDPRTARDRETLTLAFSRWVPESLEGDEFRAAIRRLTRAEKARIALRELLSPDLGGADVMETSRELSLLASLAIEWCLAEALRWARRRFGRALTHRGTESSLVVLGMGKLGGGELNAGSDVDLIYFYDTDEGGVAPVGDDRIATGAEAMALAEYWQRVCKRLTASMEDLTEDGQIFRVDLRLRPEGSRGPLVMSVAAAERYYESFGRLWERAALLRARPVAGDLALGDLLLGDLAPFIWRRRIDPKIAVDLNVLVARSRLELSADAARDLKLGPGGIREAEFFVQTLQLIWGGKNPELRERGTLSALSLLRSKGFCTDGEAVLVRDAYLAFRRAEHVAQWSYGVQTHLLPKGDDLERAARILRFASGRELEEDLRARQVEIHRLFQSLLPEGELVLGRWDALLAMLDSGERDNLRALVAERLGVDPEDERALTSAANLATLATHPDSVLGPRARETYPGLAANLLDAAFDSADPPQAVRYLRIFFERVRHVAVYVRLAFADPPALRRLVSVLGASAFVGDALCNNPELCDMILFSRERLSLEAIRLEVREAAGAEPPDSEDPEEFFVEKLRLAKTRITLGVALHDLSSEMTGPLVRGALSELADASLGAALERATGQMDVRGITIIALGKLGSREISYGSDLDVLFLFDPELAPEGADPTYHFTRVARRVIRYISTFHGAGPGYELDTRLRPSGNQGLLVTTLEAFSKHHGLGAEGDDVRSAIWERMALLRARPVAGDLELGQRALQLFARVVDARPPAWREAAEEIRHIKSRVEKESSKERPGFLDLKLGQGGVLEIEFILQFLQVMNGPERPTLRGATDLALLDALVDEGLLLEGERQTLIDALRFFRALELKVRVVRADAAHVLDLRSETLEPLARRMGFEAMPPETPATRLEKHYRTIARRVRAIFDRILPSATLPHGPGGSTESIH